MICPDLAHEQKRIDDHEERIVRGLAQVEVEEYYNETQYGMDPEYDTPEFGDLSDEEVAMLNRALNLTNKLMLLTVPEATVVLNSAHDSADEFLLSDDIPF